MQNLYFFRENAFWKCHLPLAAMIGQVSLHVYVNGTNDDISMA